MCLCAYQLIFRVRFKVQTFCQCILGTSAVRKSTCVCNGQTQTAEVDSGNCQLADLSASLIGAQPNKVTCETRLERARHTNFEIEPTLMNQYHDSLMHSNSFALHRRLELARSTRPLARSLDAVSSGRRNLTRLGLRPLARTRANRQVSVTRRDERRRDAEVAQQRARSSQCSLRISILAPASKVRTGSEQPEVLKPLVRRSTSKSRLGCKGSRLFVLLALLLFACLCVCLSVCRVLAVCYLMWLRWARPKQCNRRAANWCEATVNMLVTSLEQSRGEAAPLGAGQSRAQASV